MRSCPVSGIMVEQFVVDGPHARLYDAHNQSWVKLMNWQHGTMYLFFGIAGIALVVSTASKMVPVGVDRLALSIALFVEGKSWKKFGVVWGRSRPASRNFWSGSNAPGERAQCSCFVTPGFLFYYHVHSRPPLDAHIHSLLLVAVFSGSASTMMEVFMRDRFILEMLKAVLFILQGSWFYQVIHVIVIRFSMVAQFFF